MTPDDQATGLIFKVQLKGTSSANLNNSGQLVFSGASVDRFSYYLSKLHIPIIFIVCDVTSGHCYWSRVQGNRRLERDHADAVAKHQETFTIKIPISQRLEKTPEGAEPIIEAVEDAANVITLKGLLGLSPESVREHIGHDPDLEQSEKQFRLFAGLAANESIRKLLLSGEVDAACAKSQDLLESPSESPEIRILGGWNLANCLNVSLRRRRAPGAGFEAAKYKLGIAYRILEVARSLKCETRLRRYSQIYARSARMHINGRVAMALATSENVQGRQGETMSAPITRLQRMEVSALVARDFFKLRNSLFRLGSDGFYSVMPYALSEVAESILSYVSALRILGQNDLAEAYVNALFDFLPFCIGIIRRFDNQHDIEEILSSLGLRVIGLANISDPESMPSLLRRYEEAIEGEPKFECIDAVLSSLREQVERFQEDNRKDVKPTMAELRDYFAERAAELGINLSDPDDMIAQVVRVGIEDLDPTRVSKNCRHIHVMTASYGMPAEMLGLPTAGSKRVVCLKHGHSIETLKLDAAYESFKQHWPWDDKGIRCDNCPDIEPHPEGWQWSQEWDLEQHAIYRDRVKNNDNQEDSPSDETASETES